MKEACEGRLGNWHHDTREDKQPTGSCLLRAAGSVVVVSPADCVVRAGDFAGGQRGGLENRLEAREIGSGQGV